MGLNFANFAIQKPQPTHMAAEMQNRLMGCLSPGALKSTLTALEARNGQTG